MKTLVYCTLTALMLQPAIAAQAQKVHRILPLGDSITQGVYPAQSYRYRLWVKLINDGLPFDYIGSRTDNYNGNSGYPNYAGRAFDRQHEGHGGWRAQDLIDGCTESDPCRTKFQGNLGGWLSGYTPDIVLLHIGTNDILQGAPWYATAFSVWYTIQYLRLDNPKVTILLGQIIPINGRTQSAMFLNYIYAFLAELTTLPSSPVILVDHFTGFNLLTLTDDGRHPNAAGEEWMATRWRTAIREVVGTQTLTRSEPPRTPVSNNARDVIGVDASGELQAAGAPRPARSQSGV